MLAAVSGTEREYLRDHALEGREPTRRHGRTTAGAGATDESALSTALHLRDQETNPRDIAKHLVVTTGGMRGRHPSPATARRMLREPDETVSR